MTATIVIPANTGGQDPGCYSSKLFTMKCAARIR